MAYFDKPVKFRNLQAPSTDYHFRIYKTRDEDNMHMIELCDEANLKFIYRLRLTPKSIDKICRENDINRDNFNLKYIQEFVSELSENQWLTCEIAADNKECNICFYEVRKNLGEKCMLKLPLNVVEKEEFNQYVMDTAEKYKKRYLDKKQENESQKKKLESYEKKVQQLKKEVEEGNKLKKELNDLKENYERIEFRYERLKADYERQKQEIAEHIQEKEELQHDFDELEEENEKTEKEADELVRIKEELEDEVKGWEDKCKNLKEAVKEIADKGRRHEAKIIKYAQDIEELQKRLTQYENSYKRLKAENTVLLKESSTKDNQIAALTNEVENFTLEKEFTTKIIEELKANQKSPTGAAVQGAQPPTKTARSRPWAIVDQNLQLKKR